MNVMYERCCGMDVHKKTIVACLMTGKKAEIRHYDTSTSSIREMANWLIDQQCEQVAMESTGSYWKPIYNVLEMLGLEVIIVNAQHMKNLPGHKTDQEDAKYIAELLQVGLLRASYVPDREQRDLRELSRYRKSQVEERVRELNRLEKTLQSGNIKISSHVSRLTTKSAKSLIRGIIRGEKIDNQTIEHYLFGSTGKKRQELLGAIDGYLSGVQKKLIEKILEKIEYLSRNIEEIDEIIDEEMKVYEEAVEQLSDIPGISETSAKTILAEIGLDMTRFPTAGHLASWMGLCPGNNESGGKRRNGRTTKGNQTAKTTLVQCAVVASRTKGSFLKAKYESLRARRGAKRAFVAVAHQMVVAIYHMLLHGVPYVDLGETFYDQFHQERKKKYHLKKLQDLGVDLTVLATI